MIYVFPHCAAHEDDIRKIQGISRLFAYPARPHRDNNGEALILDSGAFGLSVSGRKMTIPYMRRLSEHYEKYGGENTICIAPDVYLSPMQSIWNMRMWHKMGLYPHVAAVMQPEREGVVDIKQLAWQAEYYRKYTDVICLSVNKIRGEIASAFEIERIFKYAKSIGYRWIHVLGAGWSIKDIRAWKQIQYFDSMDSIAYYSTRDKNAFGSLDPVKNIKTISSIMEENNE